MSDETSHRPSYWAYQLLHIGFTVAPILAGVDKFFNRLTQWDMYLSGPVAGLLPVGSGAAMRGIGVVEIIAGLIVAVKPRIGGFIVAAWLLASIINLLLARAFYDVALRDLGLLLGALALALLAREYSK